MKHPILAGCVALSALLSAQAEAGPLTQYGDVFTGLAFNEVAHSPQSSSVTEVASKYTYIYNKPGANPIRLYDLPPLASLAGLGQFRYELYYDPTVAGNASATTMSQIDWSEGVISFLQGDPIDLYAHGTTTVGATLTVLGGEFSLNRLHGQQAGNVEDLPFDLGTDLPLNYEITGDSFLTLQLELKNGVGTVTNTLNITLTPNQLNVSAYDPFNAVMIDPANGVPEDLAFFIWDWTSSFTCTGTTTEFGFADPCGPFGQVVRNQNGSFRRYDRVQFGIQLAGWGHGDILPATVAEPESLILLFSLGALALGATRRRRA